MRNAIGCVMLLSALAALVAQPSAVTYRSAVDNTEQPYALYLPKSLDRARKYPLVIGLHEEDSNHVVNLKHLFGVTARFGKTGLQALTSFPPLRDQEYIVEQDVYDVMAEVKRRYPVDEDRVYLTGSSMGGGGALWMALTRPDV